MQMLQTQRWDFYQTVFWKPIWADPTSAPVEVHVHERFDASTGNGGHAYQLVA